MSESFVDLLPNYTGAKLVYGSVRFGTDPPCEPNVDLAEYPILAFQRDGGRWIPVTVNGPVKYWGELRVSVAGSFVHGITIGGGVELPDGTLCGSLEEFKSRMTYVIGLRVREIRTEKGFSPDRLPAIQEVEQLD